jgi:hypothetical protein
VAGLVPRTAPSEGRNSVQATAGLRGVVVGHGI